jgi:hypothetical protein
VKTNGKGHFRHGRLIIFHLSAVRSRFAQGALMAPKRGASGGELTCQTGPSLKWVAPIAVKFRDVRDLGGDAFDRGDMRVSSSAMHAFKKRRGL